MPSRRDDLGHHPNLVDQNQRFKMSTRLLLDLRTHPKVMNNLGLSFSPLCRVGVNILLLDSLLKVAVMLIQSPNELNFRHDSISSKSGPHGRVRTMLGCP